MPAEERRVNGRNGRGHMGRAAGKCLDIRGRDFASRDPAEVGPDVRKPSLASRLASEVREIWTVYCKSAWKGGGKLVEYSSEVSDLICA